MSGTLPPGAGGGGGGLPHLTPAQQAQAKQAAGNILWHQQQIARWEPLYKDATQAGNVEEAQNIAGVIDMHQQAIDSARQTLADLGL